MKKMIFIFIASVLFTCVMHAQIKNKFNNDVLKGKVKEVTQKLYVGVLKNGVAEKGSLLNTEAYTYDEKGNCTMLVYGNADNTVSNKTVLKYNDQSQLIQVEQFKYEIDKEAGVLEGSLTYREIYTYDASGKMSEMSYYKSDSTLSYVYKYKYDAKGNMIEQAEWSASKKLNYKLTFKYDLKGNMIEKLKYKTDGSVGYKYTFKYDDKGNMLEKVKQEADNKVTLKQIYKYDAQSRLIEAVTYNAAGVVEVKENTRYENEDAQTNWQKKLLYENDKPSKITEQTVVYYK